MAASAPVQPMSNTLATVGFILSFFFSVIGLIVCIMGLKRSKEPAYAGNGKTLAIAGIIISSIGTVFYVIYLCIIIAGLGVALA